MEGMVGGVEVAMIGTTAQRRRGDASDAADGFGFGRKF